MLKKIKREMARKQLTEEGRRRLNSRVKIPAAPNGKIGKNGRYGKRVSNSDFAFDWKKACERRVESFKMKNRQEARG